MAGFKGQAEYSVDSKGRVAIPAKMRTVLNPEAKGTFTVTRGLDRCIFLYPLDHWEQLEQRMSELNQYNKTTRDFLRATLMWAEEVPLDAQGRVGVPKSLLEYAGVGEKALIIGALDHIEIWDPGAFGDYMSERSEDFETLAERVMGL
jgi:MraZ protein